MHKGAFSPDQNGLEVHTGIGTGNPHGPLYILNFLYFPHFISILYCKSYSNIINSDVYKSKLYSTMTSIFESNFTALVHSFRAGSLLTVPDPNHSVKS
jgi:hypothetical protein